MYSAKTRQLLHSIETLLGNNYRTEDERNDALVEHIGRINASIMENPGDIEQAMASHRTGKGAQATPPMEDERSALQRVEDELSAQEATPTPLGALKGILSSVEREEYKVELTMDGAFVVTYNAKIGVAACVDHLTAEQVARALNDARGK